MTYDVPAALANTAEAELQTFRDYIEGDGADFVSSVGANCDDLTVGLAALFAGGSAKDASDTLAQFDDLLTHAEAIVTDLRDMREAYLDQLGIEKAVTDVALNLPNLHSKPHVDALRRGLDLMWHSDRKMARELREALMKLGMPKKGNYGFATNTFRRTMTYEWLKPAEDAAMAAPDYMKDAIDGALKGFGIKRNGDGRLVATTQK